MQQLETKPTEDRLLILDRPGRILRYRPDGRGDRLGPLEKRILAMTQEGSEIAHRRVLVD
jgi:hypothetical protein